VTERSESQTEDVATEEDAESQASVMDEEDRATADAESVDGKGELFPASERKELEQRWNDIQAGFVDQPRASVEEANALVSELMDRLVSSFTEQRDQLEAQWERGGDVTTEDLRVALMRYRSFFGRLLEVPVDR
jgi:hypothetical protein